MWWWCPQSSYYREFLSLNSNVDFQFWAIWVAQGAKGNFFNFDKVSHFQGLFFHGKFFLEPFLHLVSASNFWLMCIFFILCILFWVKIAQWKIDGNKRNSRKLIGVQSNHGVGGPAAPTLSFLHNQRFPHNQHSILMAGTSLGRCGHQRVYRAFFQHIVITRFAFQVFSCSGSSQRLLGK